MRYFESMEKLKDEAYNFGVLDFFVMLVDPDDIPTEFDDGTPIPPELLAHADRVYRSGQWLMAWIDDRELRPEWSEGMHKADNAGDGS